MKSYMNIVKKKGEFCQGDKGKHFLKFIYTLQ